MAMCSDECTTCTYQNAPLDSERCHTCLLHIAIYKRPSQWWPSRKVREMAKELNERYYVEQLKRPEKIWVYVQGSIGTWEHAADVCRKYSDAGIMARVVRVAALPEREMLLEKE